MNLNLFIATPMYGGMCAEPYMRSMFLASAYMTRNNIKYGLSTISNESLVMRARDKMVSFFLETDCTHLYFIDGDIEFTPEDLIRLPMQDKDVICAAYPMKQYHFDRAINRTFTSIDELKSEIIQYVVEPEYALDSEGNPSELKIQDGLIKMKHAGTGFICIKRSVIEQMVEHYKDLECSHENNGPKYPALYQCYTDENGLYLSEDYAFCRRWQDLGGDVWLDPQVKLNHFGGHFFNGYKLM